MSGDTTRIRVLIVDDETRFRSNVKRLLAAKGFDVACVESGLLALEQASEQDFDVIVLDQKMPGMDGLETMARLREQGCEAKVIFLTGHTSMDDAAEGMSMGAVDYQLKPLSVEDLAKKIVEVHTGQMPA